VTVFQRIQSGVGGTAMPAFAGTLSEEQIWDLAHFVLSLAPAGPATQASGPAHR
jgi:mono/diheme cytochrome c family protein